MHIHEVELRKLISKHSLSPQKVEKRRQGRERLKERLSQIPWYAEQGRKHGDRFWRALHGSCVLS